MSCGTAGGFGHVTISESSFWKLERLRNWLEKWSLCSFVGEGKRQIETVYFSQNERRTDLQKVASKLLIFAPRIGLSKFSDTLTPFFRLRKTMANFPGEKFSAMHMMNKCTKFHGDIPSG